MIKTTLGQVADIITGPFGSSLHQYEYVSFGIPVIMPQDIGNRNLSYEKIAYITQEKANELSRYLVDTNDIVYARRGDIEKHAFITDNDKGAICGTGCLRVRIMDKNVNPLFLSFYLNKPETKKWISLHAVGSNMPNINTEILSKVPIVLPDKKEQDSIASFLDSIDNKISNNNDICSDLEGMAKLLYNYWFVQFDFPDENGKPYKSSGGKMVWNEELKREIPDGWNLTTIGDITICHDSERVPVASKDRETMKGNIPYYGATGIMGYVNSHIFDGDYVLMAEDGSIMDDKGYPILQRISGKTWVNNHAHVLEPIKGYSCKMLLMMFKDIPVRLIKTGSIQMKINQDNMNAYKLIDIPETIKMKAQAILDRIDEQQLALQQENQELASLRDFLLPMLMNGQVTVKKGETQ